MSMQQVRNPGRASFFWVAAAAGCAGGFLGLYLWAVGTQAGQRLDIELFATMQSPDGVIEDVASVLRWLLPALLAVPYLILAVAALRKRRFALVAGTVLLGAVSFGLARLFRLDVLARPDLGDHGYMYNTYPSGHVAATTALAIAVLLLWPRAPQTVGVLVAVLVTLACVSSVVGHAHRPSDAIGAVLLVAALSSLGMAARPRAAWADARSADGGAGDSQ